ncbi:MAG: TIGR03663 family protein, partial [Chloroflexi bacterium]|nr:TIGR03663 family protein [Chloroflexota bacterium]
MKPSSGRSEADANLEPDEVPLAGTPAPLEATSKGVTPEVVPADDGVRQPERGKWDMRRRATRATRANGDDVSQPPRRQELSEIAISASGGSVVISDDDPSVGPNVLDWLRQPWLYGLNYGQTILLIILIIITLVSRFINVGDRAMHHDESMHAKFAWDTFRGQVYKYNPLLHGPFQFLSVATSFWIFGATEATARAVPAFFGVGLVAISFLWRRWLGTTGWIVAVAMFVFSPSFIYFARMLREDSYTATWTLLAMTGFIGFILHRRRAWYYTFCVGLSFERSARERGASGTFTSAWFQLWRDRDGFWGLGTFSGGIVIFFLIFIVLFTSLFTNFGGIREGLIGGIRYWLEQHGVQRGNQPWYYYILILSAYETLPFVFFIAGTVEYLRRPTWLTSFLLWWGWGALTIYSWAGEKMPWLVIHIATPMVFVAARFIGDVWRDPASDPWKVRITTGVGVLLSFWCIHTGWPVNFDRPDTPRDLLVYTQTAPDVKKVMADIERISLEQTANSRDIGVTVQSGTWWPFSWYLRDYKNVDYPAQLTSPATKPIVLIALEDDEKNAPFLNGYTKTKYKMRWWYPEDYRNITLQSFRNVITNSETRSGLWQWLIYREPTQPLGSYDFYVYLKDGISTGTPQVGGAPLAPSAPRINPEAYAGKSVPVQLLSEFGTTGKANGQYTLPRGIASAGANAFFIADTGNHRIQKVDRAGKVLLAWGTEGSGDGQFKEPMGVATDRDGNVFVADTWNHRIQKFDPNGKFLLKWSGQNG